MRGKFPMVPRRIALAGALAGTILNGLACGDGPGTLATVPGLGGSSLWISALNAAGQMTGFGYTTGDTAAHALLYNGSTTLDLGTLGGSQSQGFAVNSLGEVVGEANLAGDMETRAFVFRNGALVDLGTLGGSYSSATAVNDAGQVVGRSLLSGDAQMEAFLHENDQMIGLGSLGGGASAATAINSAGTIVGDSLNELFENHAFLYTNGVMVDLGTLGGDFSTVRALNSSDVVVGESTRADFSTRGFVYADGAMYELGTLGGSFSSAWFINEANQVAGVSTTTNGELHAFLYAGGAMTDLGTLGGNYTAPSALNNLGQVVGTSLDSLGNQRAFLWQNGALTDLNSVLPANSGWELLSAEFINDNGEIVGYGFLNGNFEWFLMTLGSANNPPVAVAGVDQTVQCGASVVLDGSLSSDPDGDALAYEWSQGGAVVGTTSVLSLSLPMGSHTFVLKVTDPCGTSSEDSVSVTVSDTAPPVITSAPASLSVAADANCQGAVPDILSQVTAADACDPAGVQLTQTPPSGALLPRGEHVITILATDASGNSSSRVVTLSVADRTPPVIQSVNATPNELTSPNHQVFPVTVSVSATDNCDAAPACRITSITANEPVDAGDIQITGDLTANLAASRNPSGSGRVYTIHVECRDASGNIAVSSTTVNVVKGNGGKKNPKK